jgi:hypothetical protein
LLSPKGREDFFSQHREEERKRTIILNISLLLGPTNMESVCFLCNETSTDGLDCLGNPGQSSNKNGHYYCKSCFQNYVYSKVEYLTKEKATIKCADVKCKHEFDKRFIRNSNCLSSEQYEYYLYKLLSFEEQTLKRQSSMGQKNGDVPAEQLFHEKNILNLLLLKCPNEKCSCLVMLDQDFKECFKLTCDQCRHNICGWCFLDLGTKTDYYHISNCIESENPGNLYAKSKPYETFYNKHHRRMVRNIIHYLLYSIANNIEMRSTVMKSLEEHEQMKIILKFFPEKFWQQVNENGLTNKVLSEYESMLQQLQYKQFQSRTTANANNDAAVPPDDIPPPGQMDAVVGPPPPGRRRALNIMEYIGTLETYIEYCFHSLEAIYMVGVRALNLLDSPEQYLSMLPFLLFLPFLPSFLKPAWILVYGYFVMEKLYHAFRNSFFPLLKILIHFAILFRVLPIAVRYFIWPVVRYFWWIALPISLILGFWFQRPLQAYYQRMKGSFFVVTWALIMSYSLQSLFSHTSSYLNKLFLHESTSLGKYYYPKTFLLYFLVMESFLMMRRINCKYYRGRTEFLQSVLFLQFSIPFLVDGLVKKPVLYESSLLPFFVRLIVVVLGELILTQLNFLYVIKQLVPQLISR